MFSDVRRKVSLRRAQAALRGGNLEEAGTILNAGAVRDLRQGQELRYALARALVCRARSHVDRGNWPEALDDVCRAIEFGGAEPERISLRNSILEHTDAVPAGRAPRYVLWIDGVGTYVVLPAARVTLGPCEAAPAPDLALPGSGPDASAEIRRSAGAYRLSARARLDVNDRPSTEHRLVSGDRFRLGGGPEVRFYLPCPVSTSAVLRLQRPTDLPGGSDCVILVDRFLVVARSVFGHIQTDDGPGQLAIVFDPECSGVTR